MHVPSRSHSQASTIVSQREGDVQTPAVRRPAESVVSGLPHAVTHVGKNEQWLREEHLLGLAVYNAVLQVLATVSRVQLEAGDTVEVKH
jgi:hypothetical protein